MIRYALLAALTFATTANATSLGPEEVVNGTFDTTDNWTLGYSWQILPAPGGLAFHNEGYTATLSQAIPLQAGKTYRVSYKVTGSYMSTNPIHLIRLRGNTVANGPWNSGDGVFTADLVAPAGVWSLDIRPGSGFAGIVDDVSVREVLP